MIDARPLCQTDAGTLLEILDFQAGVHPHHCAFTFCRDDGERAEVTFAELASRARAIAATLQRQAEVGDRVLLVYPPGLDFVSAFFGCLYAGVLAVPATYPKPRRPMPRLAAIARDCHPAAVLTTTQTLTTLELARTAPELEALPWLASDEIADEAEADWRRPEIEGDSLAFLQYTSGSTSDPRGVKVSHANLLHNLEMIRQGFGIGEVCPLDGTAVFWLPAYHDMGLIGGILEPLYIGGHCVLMSPASFLQRPLRWLQSITEYQATVSGAPNFAYELCIDKITPAQRENLDLSSWKIAFCGAEPIRAETLEQFAEAFAPCGFRSDAFYPCYGLAEATLIASGGRGPAAPVIKTVSRCGLANHEVTAGDGNGDSHRLVSCGGALLNQDIRIVNPDTRKLCPEDRVGEIWIEGPSVSAGYWNGCPDNATTFGARLAGRNGHARFLRTGDLGFVSDGQLFVTGRMKDVIIIRGRNLYPQDIEHTAEQSHAALPPSGGAVFSVEHQGEEQLVIVHEIDRQHRDADHDEILRAIRREIAREHEVDVLAAVLIRPTSLPRTTSGKVQRSLCRQRYLDDELKVVARWPAAGPHQSNGRGNNKSVSANGNGHHDHCSGSAEHRNGSNSCASAASKPASPPKPSIPASTTGPLAPEEVDRLAERIETWLLDWLVARADVPRSELDRDKPLADYGIDSLTAVELSQELESWLGIELTPTLAWNHPTAATLARYLAGEASRTVGGQTQPSESEVCESVSEDDFEALLAEIEGMSDDEAETSL